MEGAGTTALEELVSGTLRSQLQPLCFFVSWQGVLTMAYSGFPPALARLKQDLEQLHLGLPRENPGSKWPKTSLACLKNHKRLTPQQLDNLQVLCKHWSLKLHGMRVPLDSAAVAVYTCRSLERLVSLHTIPFAITPEDQVSAEPSSEEREKVRRVMAEADHPDYWFSVSKDGNREQHYQGDHVGATLLCNIKAECVTNLAKYVPLSDIVGGFREQVEAVLPGMYTWFSMQSLHITIRAIT